MGRRNASRRRLGINKETLRRLDSLRPEELRRVVGGTENWSDDCLLDVNPKYKPLIHGNSGTRHCLSGDD